MIRVDISKAIGRGYGDFWKFKGAYRVCKGSRASKKSKTTALWFIYNIMKYKDSNAIVIRKVYRTLKDSCFAELKWAITRLKVNHHWTIKESPLEMTYRPTGQKILFRGLDDPMKVTSVTVDTGYLCWCWIEESFEISKEEDFDMLDESIRGQVPPHLFKQTTLTLNPWNERIWIKKRFFDAIKEQTCDENGVSDDKKILTKTTNYLCNEFLDDADRTKFEAMKTRNPKRYKVAGLGGWGISDGLVFENWVERDFDIKSDEFRKEHPNLKSAFGLDFGYTNDPSALFCGLVDTYNKEIFVFDEMYQKALSNEKIYSTIASMGYSKECIRADSSEPKSIDRLYDLGLHNIRAARKGKDSVLNGIDYLQDYRIIVHPKCVDFINEISNYSWDEDRFGNKLNKPCDDFNHLMDAMRYAMEEFSICENYGF